MAPGEMILVTPAQINETLEKLRAAGLKGNEGIVLWAGERHGDTTSVKAVIVPEHEAAEDRFWIPEPAMRALQTKMRESRLVLLAQVHSHPREAFHSEADDTWAILRRRGALSLVVPYFAATVSVADFFQKTAVFELSERSIWTQIEPGARIEAVHV